MSTPHIEAKTGEIAEKILLPGDPLRAKFIAENFLENPQCYNKVRGMLGYTGYYKGEKVSVQGTGMGISSASIYIHELIQEYGVKKLIRVGSAGSLQPQIKLYDIVIAMSASIDSNYNFVYNINGDYAATSNWDLLKNAVDISKKMNLRTHIGNVLSSIHFYDPSDSWKKWAKMRVLCVEMEIYALYTIASYYNVDALGILTISDSFLTQETTSSKERELKFKDMAQVALDAIVI